MTHLAAEIARTRTKGMHIHTFPDGEAIVSMIQFKGRALVATNQHVYEIKDGKLVRILLQEIEPLARA